MKLDGLAALVTGGASGLGAATARMLARNGARVGVLDVNVSAGEALAQEIGGAFHRVDVTDAASVDAAIAAAETAHGVARVLVNCAGIARAMRIVDKEGMPHPLGDFELAIRINLIGTFATLSRVAARIIAAAIDDDEGGVIINTASVAAFDGQVGQAAYAASKAGVAGMTLPAARDLAPHRIRVMTIAPGIFETPMLMGLPPAAQESLGKQVPHPSRLGRPDEYALLVESIIANPMLNGEVIRLDGAIRMAPR